MTGFIINEFLEAQLGYFGNPNGYPTLSSQDLSDPECNKIPFFPETMVEDDKLVLGLNVAYRKFITEHCDIGEYVKSVTEAGADFEFGCYFCGEQIIQQHPMYKEGMDQDMKDFIVSKYDLPVIFGTTSTSGNFENYGNVFTFQGTPEQVMKNECNCPHCGTLCKVVQWEESEIDTQWIFEKGYISFVHEGRGAHVEYVPK